MIKARGALSHYKIILKTSNVQLSSSSGIRNLIQDVNFGRFGSLPCSEMISVCEVEGLQSIDLVMSILSFSGKVYSCLIHVSELVGFLHPTGHLLLNI